MEHQYLVGLKLANSNASINFQDYTDLILACVEDYNKVGQSKSKNPKYIELDKSNISPDSIVLTLYSTEILTVVGKALRHLSQLLLSHDDFKKCTVNGQLLMTFPVSAVAPGGSEKQIISISEVDDIEFMKALMDYIYKKRDADSTAYRKKRIALDQMKQIALESGILKIDHHS